MTTMISEVYDALKDATGVSEEKARKAAEAVAQYDARFTELKISIETLRSEFFALKVEFEALKVQFEALKGRINLIQWQLTLLIGGMVTLLIKAFM